MTLDEIRASDKDFLIPEDLAGVLGCNPQVIRHEAKNGTLPFPFVRLGTRTKVPRLPFIRWVETGETTNK